MSKNTNLDDVTFDVSYAGVDELPSSKRTLYNWQRASKVLLYDLGKTELGI